MYYINSLSQNLCIVFVACIWCFFSCSPVGLGMVALEHFYSMLWEAKASPNFFAAAEAWFSASIQLHLK